MPNNRPYTGLANLADRGQGPQLLQFLEHHNLCQWEFRISGGGHGPLALPLFPIDDKMTKTGSVKPLGVVAMCGRLWMDEASRNSLKRRFLFIAPHSRSY